MKEENKKNENLGKEEIEIEHINNINENIEENEESGESGMASKETNNDFFEEETDEREEKEQEETENDVEINSFHFTTQRLNGIKEAGEAENLESLVGNSRISGEIKMYDDKTTLYSEKVDDKNNKKYDEWKGKESNRIEVQFGLQSGFNINSIREVNFVRDDFWMNNEIKKMEEDIKKYSEIKSIDRFEKEVTLPFQEKKEKKRFLK